MKKLILAFSIALTCLLSFAQEAADSINEAYVKSHYTKREVYIKMRDGVNLFTTIYEPTDKSVKHPILLNRTCYSVSPYGEDFSHIWSSKTEYVRNNYILVYQDVRGKNMSDGVFENIRPFIENKTKKNKLTDEASDAYDTAEWLVKNTNNNGNIGVYGISYPGFYATMAALSGHPAIKAVSPQAPVTDWFRGDDAHHNGVFFYMDMYNFQFFFEKYMTKQTHQPGFERRSIKAPENFKHTDVYNDFLKMGAIKNLSALFGDSIIGWNEVIDHPNLDDFWEDRNVSYHCHDVKPAVMVVGGLFDAEDCYGAFRTYEAIRQQSPATELYLVEGPWSHGQWDRGAKVQFGHVRFAPNMTAEWYLANVEYPFFAYYLEGKGEKPAKGARVYDTGSCEWQYFPEGWENKVETTPFYLGADGALSTAKPAQEGCVSYISDPNKPVPYQMNPGTSRTTTYLLDDQRFAAQRPDVMVFQTEPLNEEITLQGEVEVNLEVCLSSTDADFVVKVIDVFPDDFRYEESEDRYLMSGYQMLVRGDIMRGKYRNSFSDPEPFVPGEKTTVRYSLPSMSHTFKPGHRIMIQVQSSWFPLADRNPQKFCDIYHCDDSDFQKCEISIFNSSSVNLPVKK